MLPPFSAAHTQSWVPPDHLFPGSWAWVSVDRAPPRTGHKDVGVWPGALTTLVTPRLIPIPCVPVLGAPDNLDCASWWPISSKLGPIFSAPHYPYFRSTKPSRSRLFIGEYLANVCALSSLCAARQGQGRARASFLTPTPWHPVLCLVNTGTKEMLVEWMD